VIGGYTQRGGERKYMGALLVGVYENRKLKFAGRVGTGFSEKLLKALSLELNKIAVKACPFYNLPTPGRGLAPGLTAAGMKRCVWVNPTIVCEAKFTEWTRDDRLRHPVFLGIREDKSPSSVVERRRAKDFSTEISILGWIVSVARLGNIFTKALDSITAAGGNEMRQRKRPRSFVFARLPDRGQW
jgi:ATP-dependent DNA ligase